MKSKRRKGEGAIADKITSKLLDHLNKVYPGIGIGPDHFWFQTGVDYHSTEDLARWGADIPIPGTPLKVILHSFDTMTRCAKGGISLIPEGVHRFEVIAKGRS